MRRRHMAADGQYGRMARLRDALSQSANAKENVTLETTMGFYRLHRKRHGFRKPPRNRHVDCFLMNS